MFSCLNWESRNKVRKHRSKILRFLEYPVGIQIAFPIISPFN